MRSRVAPLFSSFTTMKASMHIRSLSARAFTLIETLVVVSIVVLILTLTAPSLFSTMKATRLTSAGDSLVGFLSEAQQLAVSSNTPVEVRFFNYTTPMSSNKAYRAMQMFKISNISMATSNQAVESEVPVGTLLRIPDGIVLVDDPSTLSPLLSASGFQDRKPNGGGAYSGQTSATYNSLRFLADGSCRTVASSTNGRVTLLYPVLQKSCITLCEDIGAEITVEKLPRNFYTIQIDPFTGKIRTYRPGQF